MTEEGWDSDDWREYGRMRYLEGQIKRAANRQSSADLLRSAGIAFEAKNGGAHLIVSHPSGAVDFWPVTGLWMARNGKQGRGVRKLIKYLEQQT